MAVTVQLLLPLLKKKFKLSVQCHIFAQSPPGRRSKDKYPGKTLYRSDWCKNVLLQCYLVATVIHIQSVRCQKCVYINIYCAQYGEDCGAKYIKILGQQ